MKRNSTVLETIERKIEGLEPGTTVRLFGIIGNHTEEEIIATTKMLLMKYGIKCDTRRN